MQSILIRLSDVLSTQLSLGLWDIGLLIIYLSTQLLVQMVPCRKVGKEWIIHCQRYEKKRSSLNVIRYWKNYLEENNSNTRTVSSLHEDNTGALSYNHCCCGKAMSITQPECVCVFVALGIQHAMCIAILSVICGFPRSTIFFHIFS
jgi:hypothetical protein